MLTILKWAALATLAVAAVAILLLTLSTLLSLDWRRNHRKRTAALPRLAEAADALMQIVIDDQAFRARVWNPDGTAEPVIALHGFPQSSISWTPLGEALAERGHPVVAFDQRGYSPGVRPSGAAAYSIDNLVGDVLRVADELGFDRFHLVGHDWGAAVGWCVAISAPARVISFGGLSVPHPLAFAEAVRGDPDQRRRSRYFLLFRLPWLPELLLSFARQHVLRSVMYRAMPREHVAEYLSLVAEPGALTAMLNYYRAMGRGSGLPGAPEIELPVLFVWGNRDPAVARSGVEKQRRFVTGPYELVEIDGGHWLLERNTEQTIRCVVEHITRHSSQPCSSDQETLSTTC